MSEQSPVAQKRSLIRWTPDEWRKLARQIAVEHPEYRPSKTLAGLTTADVRDAMRKVIAADRQRTSIVNLRNERASILKVWTEVVAALAAENVSESVEAQAVKQLPSTTEEATQPIPPVSPTPPVAPVEQVKPIAPVPPTPQVPMEQANAEYFAAFSPIVGLIVKELARHMMPMMVQESLPHLRAMIGEMFVPASNAVPDGDTPMQVQLPVGLDRRRHVRPKIAVLGGNARTHNDIAAAYPLIDFVFFPEGSAGVKESIQYCDRGILLTGKCNHQMMYAAKKTLGERMGYIDGDGSSKVKELIHTWIRTGKIVLPQIQHTESNE